MRIYDFSAVVSTTERISATVPALPVTVSKILAHSVWIRAIMLLLAPFVFRIHPLQNIADALVTILVCSLIMAASCTRTHDTRGRHPRDPVHGYAQVDTFRDQVKNCGTEQPVISISSEASQKSPQWIVLASTAKA
jgi:hypothetical protein